MVELAVLNKVVQSRKVVQRRKVVQGRKMCVDTIRGRDQRPLSDRRQPARRREPCFDTPDEAGDGGGRRAVGPKLDRMRSVARRVGGDRPGQAV
jgi:hypothetical protein